MVPTCRLHAVESVIAVYGACCTNRAAAFPSRPRTLKLAVTRQGGKSEETSGEAGRRIITRFSHNAWHENREGGTGRRLHAVEISCPRLT